MNMNVYDEIIMELSAYGAEMNAITVDVANGVDVDEIRLKTKYHLMQPAEETFAKADKFVSFLGNMNTIYDDDILETIYHVTKTIMRAKKDIEAFCKEVLGDET